MELEQLYRLFQENPIVTTDTRNCTPGSLYFALRGANFDGNRFAKEAIERGCAYSITDDRSQADNRRVVWVPNVLQTLQQLANLHRRTLGTPIVAVTGTNGKTTTKELIAAVLRTRYRVLATEGNLNNHIGVPLTLLKLTRDHQLAVVEMGASKPGDIRELVEIAAPNHGLITNIGRAHLEGFGSLNGVKETKGEMYDYIRRTGGMLFVHADDRLLMEMSEGVDRLLYGSTERFPVRGVVDKREANLVFQLTIGSDTIAVATELVGGYNLPNALAAAAVGRYFHIETLQIAEALAAYRSQNMRSQWKQGAFNRLIIDAYNANPSSMEAALRNFSEIDSPSKLLILGDMKELGVESGAEHCRVVALLRELRLSNVWLCGSEYASLPPNEFTTFTTTDELIRYLAENRVEGQTILIKGSRSMKLETVVEYL